MLTMGTALSQQVDANWQTYIMIAVYFLILIVIGFYGYKQATGNLSEYMLGGRSIGPYITALSAGASDMSGWMIMGLPGSVYSTGLSAMWITIGLTLGAYINYFVVAPRLRVYTELAGDAITLPDFFKNRLNDKNNVLKIISGLIIVVFFNISCFHCHFLYFLWWIFSCINYRFLPRCHYVNCDGYGPYCCYDEFKRLGNVS